MRSPSALERTHSQASRSGRAAGFRPAVPGSAKGLVGVAPLIVVMALGLLMALVVTLGSRAFSADATANRFVAAQSNPNWDWPLLPRPEVLRPFDPPPQRWLPGHRGVDLGGVPGQLVRAAGSGTVVYAGVVAGRGVVSIEHAGGLRTTYEPVTASVRAGQTVLAGEVIGSLDPGHAGCPREACLHWGLRRGQTYLNPLVLVGPLRVRLKPVVGASG